MENQNKRFQTALLLILVLILAIFFLSLTAGLTPLSLKDIFRILFGGGKREEKLILFHYRMIRILVALLVGAGLSVSGMIFQTISKNSLASPDLLGVSAGAGLSVLLLSYFYKGSSAFGIFVLPLFSTVGALAAAILIYTLASRKDQYLSPIRLILMGIAVSSGIHSLDMIVSIRLSPEQYNRVNTWMIGSVFGNTWTHVLVLLLWLMLILPVIFYHAMDLNLLRLSDGIAIGLGSNLKRGRLAFLALAVMLAAACVSVGGAISFVGLICPHLARKMVGPNHRLSLPISALLGALLLMSADLIARTIIAPRELLLGIVVSLVGAPYFLYILLTSKK